MVFSPSWITALSWQRGYGFSSSHVWMWELDHKEVWAPKNWCFQTVVLEKTLERLLDCKDIKPVSLKGHQPWISLEELMLKLKIQYFGHLMQRANSMEKTPLTGKNPDAGKDWGQEKEVKEDEMVGWYHQLNGHEFEKTLRDSEDREAWHALAHGFTKSQAQVSDWTTIYNEHTRKAKQTK